MRLLVAPLGKIDYQTAWEMQYQLLDLRQKGEIDDVLLLVEHPPTLTIGKSGSRSNIIVSEQILQAEGVHIYEVNRGGDITYHGPGQIVGYPIMDLSNHGKDIHRFIRRIEEVFIRLLSGEYGITAERDPKYTGVWVGNEKITAIGFAVKRWVTMHGFAFNVNTQLEHFRWINPCGIIDKGVTSLQKIFDQPQDFSQVMEQVIDYFCQEFDFQPRIIDCQALFELIGDKN